MLSSVHAPNLPANICMPMMAKTTWKTKTTAKTSTTEGRVLMREVIRIFMPGWRASSRRGRSTRRMRRHLSFPNTGTMSASSPRIEIITMKKSRMFQPCFRYALGANKKPNATILSIISSTKSAVKMRLSRSSWALSSESGSRRGTSMARQTEEAIMSRMMN